MVNKLAFLANLQRTKCIRCVAKDRLWDAQPFSPLLRLQDPSIFHFCTNLRFMFTPSLPNHAGYQNDHSRNNAIISFIQFKFSEGGSYFAEVGNWPIFMAANGNIAYISRISDTKTVMETEISYFRGSENGHCQYNSHGHRKS